MGRDIVRLRAVKSPWEVARIRASAAVTAGVYDALPGILREGMSEAQFAGLRRGRGAAPRPRGRHPHARLQPGDVLRAAAHRAQRHGRQLPRHAPGRHRPEPGGGPGRELPPHRPRRAASSSTSSPCARATSATSRASSRSASCPRRWCAPTRSRCACRRTCAAAARPGVTCRALYELRPAAAAEAEASATASWATATPRYASSATAWAWSWTSCRCSRPATWRSRRAWSSPSSPSSCCPGLGAIGIENTWLRGRRGRQCAHGGPRAHRHRRLRRRSRTPARAAAAPGRRTVEHLAPDVWTERVDGPGLPHRQRDRRHARRGRSWSTRSPAPRTCSPVLATPAPSSAHGQRAWSSSTRITTGTTCTATPPSTTRTSSPTAPVPALMVAQRSTGRRLRAPRAAPRVCPCRPSPSATA